MQTLTSRQSEIVSASIEIIAKKGVQHLTIKNIAQFIKISEAAIYRHFKSKIDILLAILSNFKSASQKTMHHALTTDSKWLKILETVFISHLDNFTKVPPLASVIFSEEIFQNDLRLSTEVYSLMQTNFEAIQKMITQGQQSGEIRTDICEEQITTIIMGTLRLHVNKWKLSDFSFDLKQEGINLWKTIKKLIST